MDTNSPQVTYPPIPEGAPFLFENQELPFAGDIHIEGEFLKLRDQFGIKTAIETGTCYGSTTLWLTDHFHRVLTAEINEQFAHIAFRRLSELVDGRVRMNFVVRTGDSAALMAEMIAAAEGSTLFFLDAHFEDHCPLLDELKAIADAGIKPVICVHDVMVPGRKDLGYDTWNGQAFTYAWLRPSLEKIYGPNGFQHYFNTQATGAKRGVIYIHTL